MAVDPDVITDAIEDLAAAPKKVTNAAGESIEEQSLADLLAVQKQAAADDAVTNNASTRGITFNKFSHRGTQG